MKSKSFDLKKSPADTGKHNKTYDFVGYYKNIETSKLNAKLVSDESVIKENASDLNTKTDTPRHEGSLKKKKSKNEPVAIAHINIDGNHLLPSTGRRSPVEAAQHTSTPYSTDKCVGKASKVKSIMKNSIVDDEAMDGSSLDDSTFKPKKRNKSVSFMLEDNEEVVTKKSKSDETCDADKINDAKKKAKSMKSDMKKLKKIKKLLQAEKENKADTSLGIDDTESLNQNNDSVSKKSKKKFVKPKSQPSEATADTDIQVEKEKKKKSKKQKKMKETDESSAHTETEANNNEETEHKVKRLKKKKRQARTIQTPETTETEGEPVKKSRKKEIKPEIVAADLENLSIGDNPHTLTNLLDEMTVVEKDKKKRNKIRRKKDKKSPVTSTSEATDLEKIEEGKEKIKWKKRKWNKDKKADVDNKLAATVMTENLPISIMMEYKKLLVDHFGKFGLIQRVGVAEMFPTEDHKPVFTTTIQFYSEDAAEKALEEDNTILSGSRIRVRRPLPATETTLVVRSYAELSEQAISSVFSTAGRVRSIRMMVKGRKAMSTAFVEFDGPESVERALKMAEDVRIGGKKIHVSRYEHRHVRKQKPAKSSAESENDASDDSN